MLLENGITVVAVNKGIVPNDQRREQLAPNEVPAPVCAAALSGSLTENVRSWHGITFRRLMKDSRFGMKKAGRSADTTTCFFQA